MGHVIVGRWGNNLAVRLPGDIVQAASIRDGERVDITVVDGDIMIRRITPPTTLETLFEGQSQDQWRAAYADAYDWGPDIGREIVPE